MDKIPLLKSIQKFLFDTPLYSKYEFPTSTIVMREWFHGFSNVDGYCVECNEKTTFHYTKCLTDTEIEKLCAGNGEKVLAQLAIYCARSTEHQCVFLLMFDGNTVQKIGQFPSLADITLANSKHHTKILCELDRKEFNKAIGLAAHGVGIGSFVYLRRVLERLIYRRFEEYKDADGLEAERFTSSRFSEKIEMLKNHLPSFLVENKAIYGILSKGVHDLSEEDCLAYFEVVKLAVEEILEEDKRKLEAQKRKEKLVQEISKIRGKASG